MHLRHRHNVLTLHRALLARRLAVFFGGDIGDIDRLADLRQPEPLGDLRHQPVGRAEDQDALGARFLDGLPDFQAVRFIGKKSRLDGPHHGLGLLGGLAEDRARPVDIEPVIYDAFYVPVAADVAGLVALPRAALADEGINFHSLHLQSPAL